MLNIKNASVILIPNIVSSAAIKVRQYKSIVYSISQHDFGVMCFCCIISIGVGEFVSRMGLGLVLKHWLAWAGAMDMGEMEGGKEEV